MISYISGTIQEIDGANVLIINHGIGYEVVLCGTSISILEGQEIALYIKTFIKDDHVDLYGFIDKEALKMFSTLQLVSGVGSKSAAHILNAESVEKIVLAVTAGDVATFQKIPGIGKKVASRIILELQSKLGETETLHKLLSQGNKKELTHALRSLGYGVEEISTMIISVDTNMPLEEQIQQALQTND